MSLKIIKVYSVDYNKTGMFTNVTGFSSHEKYGECGTFTLSLGFQTDDTFLKIGTIINVEDFSEGEPSFEELEKEFAPVEDLVPEKKDDTNTQKDIKVEADDGGNTYRTMSEQGNKSPIVLGKIDLPASNASRFVSKESVKEGSIRNGIFHEGKYQSKDYIEDRGIPHPIEVREVIDGETLTEGDEIIYELKSEPHKTKPKKKYLFAIKVRLKE